MQADMRTDRDPERRPLEPGRPARPPFRVTPQAVLGLVIVVFGAALMADNLGWVESDQVFRFWPLVLVAIGILRLIQPVGRSGRVFGGVMLLVGLGLTAEFVLGLPVDVNDWWPLVLIAIGVVILLRSRGGGPEAGAVTQDERLSEFAVWAGKVRRVATPAFRYADLTAVMGGVELDLRGAATATGEAVIDVFVMWGGIELWVPPDWAVSNQTTALMGGVEDKSSGTQDARHRLVIRGFVVMGGLEIKT